jgi:hypothetical protein
LVPHFMQITFTTWAEDREGMR